MVKVKVKYPNLIAEGILLAKFTSKLNTYENYVKRFLFFKYTKFKPIIKTFDLNLVFIPWKHKLKELVLIKDNEIIDGEIEVYPIEWISLDKYISDSDNVCLNGLEIENFRGYSWIKENNSLLIDVLYHEKEYMDIVYNNMPNLLNEEFDEGEY